MGVEMTKLPPPEFPDDSNDSNEEHGTGVRLQKLIAHRGLASRRNAEIMIQGGLVRINGEVVTTPGTKVDPLHDKVSVEGRPVPVEPEPFLFLFYKPKGVVSTLHDPDGKTTLKEFFPQINPLIHIGRLDLQSEGVLLLTNNGDLAQRILHPRYAIPRTYLAKIQGVVSPQHLERLQSGKVKLDGHPVLPVELELERLTQTNAWYRITLTEGRNREIRRLFEVLGYFVLKLTRISFGTLDLNGLEPGEYRLVSPAEIDVLLSGAGRKKNTLANPSQNDFSPDHHHSGPPKRTSPQRDNRRGPSFSRDSRPQRDDRGPRDYSGRPSSRPGAPGQRDDRGPSSRDSRPQRDDRGPRDYSGRSSSRPGAPGQRDDRGPSSSRDSRPQRDDRGPRDYSGRPSSRPGAPGQRDDRGPSSSRDSRPQRDDRGSRDGFGQPSARQREGSSSRPSTYDRNRQTKNEGDYPQKKSAHSSDTSNYSRKPSSSRPTHRKFPGRKHPSKSTE